jgi:ubiquitin C-terminal hydrolase
MRFYKKYQKEGWRSPQLSRKVDVKKKISLSKLHLILGTHLNKFYVSSIRLKPTQGRKFSRQARMGTALIDVFVFTPPTFPEQVAL